MALSATRLVLATLLLSSSAAHAGWFDSTPSKTAPAKEEKKAADAATSGTSLEDSIHQAQTLRLNGNYPEAIKHLSQVMMVASDDPRVVSEYGKTLAAMGRAQDAISFLTRAVQLQPAEWSTFSALGVAYDQIGNQGAAQAAYEHALILKPGESSVLSNYALSRMLAHDPAMARKLAGRAEIANASGKDTKIAANIAMIRSMAPETASATDTAANTPAPTPSMPAPVAPRVPVASAPMPPLPQPAPAVAGTAPRPLTQPAKPGAIEPAPRMAQGGVVMQRVPVDPLAGPVHSAIAVSKTEANKEAATKPPRPLTPQNTAANVMNDKSGEKPAAATAPAVKSAAAATKTEANKEAAVKTEANKAVAAKADANKAVAAKADAGKPVTLNLAAEKAPVAPKAAEAKAAPHVLTEKSSAPVPVKTAALPTAKPPAAAQASVQVSTKTAVKTKDAIPGLRLSANAY